MQTVIRHSALVIKVVLACRFDLSAGHYVAHFSDVISSGNTIYTAAVLCCSVGGLQSGSTKQDNSRG